MWNTATALPVLAESYTPVKPNSLQTALPELGSRLNTQINDLNFLQLSKSLLLREGRWTLDEAGFQDFPV